MGARLLGRGKECRRSCGHRQSAKPMNRMSSRVGIVGVLAGLVSVTGCGGGNGRAVSGPVVVLQTISVTPTDSAIELGVNRQYSATGTFSDGSIKDLTTAAHWTSTDSAVATVDNTGSVKTEGTGNTTIQAMANSVIGSSDLTVIVPGHSLLKNAGLDVQFERRGWPAEYWSGQIIQDWNQFDPVLGSNVSSEISLQLDKMRAMGVNTIAFELRAADPVSSGPFVPPGCPIDPVLGFKFPQPSATELANLPLFFDMVHAKEIKVWLILNNTHMEEQTPANSQTWLNAILGTVGNHPALDLVLFGGSTHLNLDGSCGIPAEAPLWLGPGSVPARYVEWAIGFAMSKGLPARKLSAEVVIGNYYLESEPPGGPDQTDGHLWSPIKVEKTIFDDLSVPQSQRTYALSLYERRKCTDAQLLPCTDVDPHDWADETLQYNAGVIGSGARIVAVELGDVNPVYRAKWNTEHALESEIFLLQKYGIEGGAFWHWINNSNIEDADPTIADPVKRRGADFIYNPVQKEIVDMAGTHVGQVPNGSFEAGVASGGVPVNWSVSGTGNVTKYVLTQEAGEPEVPSRGINAMRIVSGGDPNDFTAAISSKIPVLPFELLTTTSNLRFGWSDDPNPTGTPASRPQVEITIRYLQSDGTPSAVRTSDTYAYFQENSTTDFATFPVQYVTPSDSAFVEIQFAAIRNGLPTGIVLDVDNVR